MKKTVLTSLIFSYLSLYYSITTNAQSLSFTDAVTEMAQENKKLKGIEKQEDASSFATKAIKSYRLPSLSITGAYTYLNDDIGFDFNNYRNQLGGLLQLPNPDILGNWGYTLQKQNFGLVSANLTWPIFTGGKIKAGIKAETIKHDIKKEATKQTKNNLITELATRYFQTQLATQVVSVRQTALKTAENHLYNAKKLEQNGIIANVETMQSEMAYTDALRELNASKQDETLARVALFGVLSSAERADSLSTALFNITTLQPLNYYQEAAKQHYPKLVEAKLQKALSEQNIAAKKGNYLPDIALLGKHILLRDNIPFENIKWFVGAGMKINVFNGLKNSYELREAKAIGESADLLIAQAERDLQTLIKKHYNEISKQQEQYTSLQKSITFAEELLRVRKKAFTEGFASATDVDDANLYLASIKIKRLQALYSMDKSLAELLETCGLSNEFSTYILH